MASWIEDIAALIPSRSNDMNSSSFCMTFKACYHPERGCRCKFSNGIQPNIGDLVYVQPLNEYGVIDAMCCLDGVFYKTVLFDNYDWSYLCDIQEMDVQIVGKLSQHQNLVPWISDHIYFNFAKQIEYTDTNKEAREK